MISKDQFSHYLIGDSAIDNSHWALLTLLDSIAQITNREALVLASESVLADWAMHMVYEEILMRKVRFPYAHVHAEEHNRMLDNLRDLHEEALVKSEYTATTHAKRMLDMVLAHIDHYDMQFRPYLIGGT